MHDLVTTLQLFLLIPALALALVSWRTSRRHRERQYMLVTCGSALAALTLVLGMFSIALVVQAEGDHGGLFLYFGPPVIVLLLSAWVVQRGLLSRRRRPSS